jgi:hypothetical protein
MNTNGKLERRRRFRTWAMRILPFEERSWRCTETVATFSHALEVSATQRCLIHEWRHEPPPSLRGPSPLPGAAAISRPSNSIWAGMTYRVCTYGSMHIWLSGLMHLGIARRMDANTDKPVGSYDHATLIQYVFAPIHFPLPALQRLCVDSRKGT